MLLVTVLFQMFVLFQNPNVLFAKSTRQLGCFRIFNKMIDCIMFTPYRQYKSHLILTKITIENYS